MAFLRVAVHLHGDPPLAQCCGHALRLLRQDHLILQTLEQHHRPLTMPDPMQRRTVPIALGHGRPWPNQALQVAALEAVGILGQGGQIRDSIATGPHPKQVTVGETAQGREPTGTAAADGHPFRIHPTGCHQGPGRRCAVHHVHHAPGPVQPLAVGATKPTGAAVVHVQHGPAPTGPELGLQAETGARHGGWATVAAHQQGR